jgi:hypothetical protein
MSLFTNLKKYRRLTVNEDIYLGGNIYTLDGQQYNLELDNNNPFVVQESGETSLDGDMEINGSLTINHPDEESGLFVDFIYPREDSTLTISGNIIINGTITGDISLNDIVNYTGGILQLENPTDENITLQITKETNATGMLIGVFDDVSINLVDTSIPVFSIDGSDNIYGSSGRIGLVNTRRGLYVTEFQDYNPLFIETDNNNDLNNHIVFGDNYPDGSANSIAIKHHYDNVSEIPSLYFREYNASDGRGRETSSTHDDMIYLTLQKIDGNPRMGINTKTPSDMVELSGGNMKIQNTKPTLILHNGTRENTLYTSDTGTHGIESGDIVLELESSGNSIRLVSEHGNVFIGDASEIVNKRTESKLQVVGLSNESVSIMVRSEINGDENINQGILLGDETNLDGGIYNGDSDTLIIGTTNNKSAGLTIATNLPSSSHNNVSLSTILDNTRLNIDNSGNIGIGTRATLENDGVVILSQIERNTDEKESLIRLGYYDTDDISSRSQVIDMRSGVQGNSEILFTASGESDPRGSIIYDNSENELYIDVSATRIVEATNTNIRILDGINFRSERTDNIFKNGDMNTLIVKLEELDIDIGEGNNVLQQKRIELFSTLIDGISKSGDDSVSNTSSNLFNIDNVDLSDSVLEITTCLNLDISFLSTANLKYMSCYFENNNTDLSLDRIHIGTKHFDNFPSSSLFIDKNIRVNFGPCILEYNDFNDDTDNRNYKLMIEYQTNDDEFTGNIASSSYVIIKKIKTGLGYDSAYNI